MSNLLDRLAMHYWSSPDSMRGVVDFIPSGGTSRCNVADLWIVAGALLLGYILVRRRLERAPHEGIASHPTSHPTSRPSRVQVAELVALLVLVTLAVIGAVHYDGVAEPPEPATA
jgi:hypothetical protein